MRVHELLLSLSLVAAVSASASTQQSDPVGVTNSMNSTELVLRTPGISMYSPGETALAVSCDDSGFRAMDGKKKLGSALLWGGGAVATLSALALSSSQSSAAAAPFLLGGVVSMIVGGRMKAGADDPGAMDLAVKSLVIGQTKTLEVQDCLGKPNMQTSKDTTEESWTYNVSRSSSTGGIFGVFLPIPQKASGEMRSVTLTFKNGLLSDVSKTSAGF